MIYNVERRLVVAALLAILRSALSGANPGECYIYIILIQRTKHYARVFY